MKIATYTRGYLRQPEKNDIDFNGLSDETVFVEKEQYDKKINAAIKRQLAHGHDDYGNHALNCRMCSLMKELEFE